LINTRDHRGLAAFWPLHLFISEKELRPMNQTRPRPTRSVAWTSASIINWSRDRLAAAGRDPREIKDEPFTFLRIREVKRRTGLSVASIYRMVSEGSFPRPVPLGHRPEAAQS
jgi:predicted DNA-binding transcriptional regulator AlpA